MYHLECVLRKIFKNIKNIYMCSQTTKIYFLKYIILKLNCEITILLNLRKSLTIVKITFYNFEITGTNKNSLANKNSNRVVFRFSSGKLQKQLLLGAKW